MMGKVDIPAELADAEVSGAASNALCQLCEECGAQLAPYLETLMALYQRVTSAGQASTSGSGPPSSLEEDSVQQACLSALPLLSGHCIRSHYSTGAVLHAALTFCAHQSCQM